MSLYDMNKDSPFNDSLMTGLQPKYLQKFSLFLPPVHLCAALSSICIKNIKIRDTKDIFSSQNSQWC